MSAIETVRAARSVRRFYENRTIDLGILLTLIDAARLSPSAGNLQKLCFTPVYEDDEREAIFSHLRWAGYMKDWEGPEKGERPSAYIVVWHDTNRGEPNLIDLGIAAQSINIVANGDYGLSCCMMGAFDRDAVARELDRPANLIPQLVIAIGYKAEKIRIEEIGADGDIKYWRTDAGVHHVPKRMLDDIVV